MMSEIILGIESSCDDTSAAVIKDGYMLSNVLASQDVHKAYGGVIPELASRAHQVNIVPVVSEALKRAGVRMTWMPLHLHVVRDFLDPFLSELRLQKVFLWLQASL